jgi:hypothetical protein
MTNYGGKQSEISVFYAWQSDLDPKTNRNFIKDAAERALKRIEKDPNVNYSLALDHDTKDVPGIPAITDTILAKIDRCDIFLADLTFVAHTEAETVGGKSKAIPNPNVLFELGYAFKALTAEKIVLVMNEAHGKADLQIFDLAHRRWPITYELPPEDSNQRTEKREALSKDLERAIREILGKTTTKVAADREEQLRERLQTWATQSKDRWQQLLLDHLPDEDPSRYHKRVWTAAYLIDGHFDTPSLPDFQNVLQKAEHHGTGWPVWWVAPQGTPLSPYYAQNLLECWMKDCKDKDAAHSDFWRASPEGFMFLLRGYWEDCRPDKVEPGKALWTRTAVHQVGECLLHARRLARALDVEDGSVMVSFRWEGLAGRVWRDIDTEKDEKTWYDHSGKVCRQKSVESPIVTVSVRAIDESLSSIISSLTKGLFLAFQFPEPSIDLIRRELSRLKKEIPDT